MSYKKLTLFLSLIVISFQVYALPSEVFEYSDGNRIVAFINEKEFDNPVRWHPFNEPPPISIKNVITRIRDYIADKNEFAHATLTEIELRRIPHHEKQWHYLLKMKTEVNDASRDNYFVILMNGKVYPAIIEPQSIK